MSTLRMVAAAASLGLAAVVPAGAEPARHADAASSWVELHASRARLVAGQTGGDGSTRLAGLEIEMEEGWKTYWRMPGDAGVPPTFDWSGSANVARIKVLYPAPTRIPEAGGEVIGYKGTVLFPMEVTPQDRARPVTLKLSLEIGICREICVPAVGTFELTLSPTRASPRPDAVAAAVERVPRQQAQRRPKDPELKLIAVSDDASGRRLTIAAAFHGAKGGDVFVEAPDGLYVPLPHKEAQGADGVVRFGVDLPDDLAGDLKGKTLTVTLVSEAGATEAQWTVP
jgi:DsbC/DsbD-like thiol-disulfide interchange protein